MTGTKKGALKARQTIYDKYGKDFYRKIGKVGGSVDTIKPKGFACDHQLARLAGSKGGSISRRGKAKNNEYREVEETD